MHKRDWLIVIKALIHYSGRLDPRLSAVHELDLSSLRTTLAIAIAGVLADHIDVPEGKLDQHINLE